VVRTLHNLDAHIRRRCAPHRLGSLEPRPDVLPGDKVDKIKELKSQGKRVAMVG
jgi:cation transport ATPase